MQAYLLLIEASISRRTSITGPFLRWTGSRNGEAAELECETASFP